MDDVDGWHILDWSGCSRGAAGEGGGERLQVGGQGRRITDRVNE